jgi:hypothetical protein
VTYNSSAAHDWRTCLAQHTVTQRRSCCKHFARRIARFLGLRRRGQR